MNGSRDLILILIMPRGGDCALIDYIIYIYTWVCANLAQTQEGLVSKRMATWYRYIFRTTNDKYCTVYIYIFIIWGILTIYIYIVYIIGIYLFYDGDGSDGSDDMIFIFNTADNLIL
jgi:hypothetical protein